MYKPAGFLRPDCAPSSECPELRLLHATAPPDQSEYPAERRAAAPVPLLESPSGQTSKSISSDSFVRIKSNFLKIHRRHRRKKWWIRILKFEFCDFWEFFKFSNRRRAVPLQPIWTIMVVARTDHSRVLVTKFHQNRSTLKGRSAGQRHTDRRFWSSLSSEFKQPTLATCHVNESLASSRLYYHHWQLATNCTVHIKLDTTVWITKPKTATKNQFWTFHSQKSGSEQRQLVLQSLAEAADVWHFMSTGCISNDTPDDHTGHPGIAHTLFHCIHKVWQIWNS